MVRQLDDHTIPWFYFIDNFDSTRPQVHQVGLVHHHTAIIATNDHIVLPPMVQDLGWFFDVFCRNTRRVWKAHVYWLPCEFWGFWGSLASSSFRRKIHHKWRPKSLPPISTGYQLKPPIGQQMGPSASGSWCGFNSYLWVYEAYPSLLMSPKHRGCQNCQS